MDFYLVIFKKRLAAINQYFNRNILVTNELHMLKNVDFY